MTIRVDSPLIPGKFHIGFRGLGVLGSQIPSSGADGPGFGYPSVDIVDAGAELWFQILTQPAGTLVANEDTSFTYAGAASSFTFKKWRNGVDQGTATVTLNVGSQATPPDEPPVDPPVVAPAPRYARPSADISAGPWAASTGTNLAAMLAEPSADATTYIEANTAGACEIKLNPVVDPLSSAGHVVRYQAWSAVSGTVRVRLMQGAFEIAAWTKSLTPAPTVYSQALTAGQIDSITDYTDLRFIFEAL